eukprot:jgi/Tetstr1/466106/TSEL_000934.t1
MSGNRWMTEAGKECEADGNDTTGSNGPPTAETTPLGGVCWTGPSSSPIGQAWNPCNEPLVCAAAPISRSNINSLMSGVLPSNARDGALNLTSGTLGICIPRPMGMSWAPTLEAGGEPPMAFFPLTSPAIATWPTAAYLGTSEGVTWGNDELFGRAMRCRQERLDVAVLQNVGYGRTDGQWAISLWIKPTNTSGGAFQYIFSHSARSAATWDANQVQIYLPEQGHHAHGVIRAIVKDETDVYTSPWGVRDLSGL